MKRYKFRDNSPYKNENAQEVGEFLEKSFKNEMPSRKEVLELAKNPKSVIHKYFDWDDKTAAQKYRLNQAGSLIAALYIEMADGNEMRAYEKVFIQELDESHYCSIGKVSESEDLISQVIDSAKRELVYWKTKYETYGDHFPMTFKAINLEVERSSRGKEKTRVKRGDRNKGSNSTNRNKVRSNYA